MVKTRAIIDEFDTYVPGKSKKEISEKYGVPENEILTVKGSPRNDELSNQNPNYDSEQIVIKVVSTFNVSDSFFKIRRCTPLKKMMDIFCLKACCSITSIIFLFNGKRIMPNQTSYELGINDGDTITAKKNV